MILPAPHRFFKAERVVSAGFSLREESKTPVTITAPKFVGVGKISSHIFLLVSYRSPSSASVSIAASCLPP
jgi:hypothetical protein